MAKVTFYAAADLEIPQTVEPPEPIEFDAGDVVAEIIVPGDVEIDPIRLASLIKGGQITTVQPGGGG